MTTHLLYLHGFRSSPASNKAQQMLAWMRQHRPDVQWWCPQLPASPRQAIDLVVAGIADWPPASMAVIGSSLGGFYATVVAERAGCRAVVLNPAIDPARDLAGLVGEHTSWHHPQQRLIVAPEFIDELRSMAPATLKRPQRYFAVIAKGDELLDWHEMLARYALCRVKLLERSDHALSDFADHLPDVLRFLDLA